MPLSSITSIANLIIVAVLLKTKQNSVGMGQGVGCLWLCFQSASTNVLQTNNTLHVQVFAVDCLKKKAALFNQFSPESW